MLRDGETQPCSKVIVDGESPVLICLLGDPAYPLLPYIMKEFANRRKTKEEQFFSYRLSSARMVAECAFGKLKARFGCLRRDMDINLDDLPYVMHSYFIIHIFREINEEQINRQYATDALKYEAKFQLPSHKAAINPFFPNAPFPYGFLMFSGGRERVHWERMG